MLRYSSAASLFSALRYYSTFARRRVAHNVVLSPPQQPFSAASPPATPSASLSCSKRYCSSVATFRKDSDADHVAADPQDTPNAHVANRAQIVHGVPSTARSLCPTAAILVDADGSGRVTLPYCTKVVHATVQSHLRSLLIERLVTPQLHHDLHDDVNSFSSRQSLDETFAAAEKLATTTLAVHDALHAIRHVAFSSMSPRLQHHSWHPLFAAYSQHLLETSIPRKEMEGKRKNMCGVLSTENREKGDGVTSVRRAALAKVLQRFGEGTSLFGPSAVEGAFFQVFAATPSEGQTPSAAAVDADACDVRAGFASANSLSPPPLFTPTTSTSVSSPADAYWECFRVDAFLPSYVQLHASVRHLLKQRRPIANIAEPFHPERDENDVNNVGLMSRPLSVIAVVAPDHLIETYAGLLSGVEAEHRRAKADTTQRSASEASTCSSTGTVELLLFNSTRLVRTFTAS